MFLTKCARRIDVTFARDLWLDPPEEWRQDIDQTLLPGGYFKEFIFYHEGVEDRSHGYDKMSEPWRTATRASGMYYPGG
ncbi:hypothetical protein QN224_28665 [Sinorhizobium sp. 8-89]|uniref:hypothetical protein n=1 Tax=Sinorhizobium sp. 7-81 TaxID=3049087 RepID=UPI0024C231DF|nr:hypothetical protein [Sinorhizobium sp. 7-81]MDK1389369.1 hypothetical protein [Sinorhizobium sp. 7-81]